MRRGDGGRERQKNGFTLLEMLVVLALLSLLLVVLTSAVSLGISARARVTAVAADQEDFTSLRRLMTQTLGNAYPAWSGVPPAQTVDFTGHARSVVFLAPALQTMGPGLARYSFSLQSIGGRNALLLQAQLDEGQTAPVLSAVFGAGELAVKITYFGPAPDGGAKLWQADWAMRTIPPELVAVQLTFPPWDRRQWPEIIVHPEIEADVTCQIDPNTHGCLGR